MLFDKLTLSIVITILALSPTVFAQKVKLHVVTESWEPFNYIDEHGDVDGSSAQWVKQVLDAASVPYQINLYPWSRSYNLAMNNENVLIYSIFKTSARKDHFHWVCPLPDPLINKIYKLSSRSDIKIEQSEDLKKHKVNAVKGTFPHERLSEMGFSEVSNLQLTMTNDNSLLLLLSGRVDLIVEVDQAVHSKLNALGYKDNVIEAVYTFQNQPASCMAISKNTSKSIVEKIQQAHRQLLRNKSS